MIKVTDKYFIDTNPNCYMVCEKTVVQTGEKKGTESWINITYHGDMTSALSNVVRRLTHDRLSMNEVISIHDAIAIMKEVNREINEWTKSLKQLENINHV